MSEKRKIGRATSIMAIATMLSRIAGLVRDIVIGRLFGAGLMTDAFFVAFTIPNLLRRFFAEGSLTAAFIPTFTEIYERDGKEEAVKVASISWTLLILIMAVVTTLGVILSPYIVKMIGYGFASTEGKLALTDSLNRMMFPYIFFVSLLALIAGILNVLGHFFIPSLSPLMLNISMIGCAYLFGDYFDLPIYALAVGVIVGGVVQLCMQFPVLFKYRIRLRFDFNFQHAAVRKIAYLMLPGIAGVAIYQINMIVTRLLASFLPEGGVSYLYYGQRLFEFPQGIFIVSLAQALLPSLSRQAAAGDDAALKESFNFAASMIILVTVPAAVGLMICATPIYSLFFLGGEFDLVAMDKTSIALVAYAPGLVFVGISRIIVPTFYAMKDTRTPVWISLWTLLVNAGLGVALMQVWGHSGLAVALTLASVFNAVMLWLMMQKKTQMLSAKMIIVPLTKIILPVVAMAGTVWFVLQYGSWQMVGGSMQKSIYLFSAIGSGVVVFIIGCILFRVEEIHQALDLVKKKLNRKRG